MLPTMAAPECTPMRRRTGARPLALRARLSATTARMISSAARQARSAWSGWSSGAPQKAITASPMYLSSVPPLASIAAAPRAEWGGVPPPRGAEFADKGGARMNTDAQTHRSQAPGLARPVVGDHRPHDRQCGAAGSLGMVGLVVRRAPESHHRVPHVLVERAAAGIDRRGHKGKVVIEEIGGVTRRETLAGGGEADDVGEHHGNRALLGLDSALAEADEAHDQAPRHVGLEPAQAGKHGVSGIGRED